MYDQNKDKLLKLFEFKQEKATVLFSIFSYDGGKPKLGISRSYEKKDGSVGYGSAGRLSYDELIFLKENLDEITSIMNV